MHAEQILMQHRVTMLQRPRTSATLYDRDALTTSTMWNGDRYYYWKRKTQTPNLVTTLCQFSGPLGRNKVPLLSSDNDWKLVLGLCTSCLCALPFSPPRTQFLGDRAGFKCMQEAMARAMHHIATISLLCALVESAIYWPVLYFG